jgi:hypothetical protein
MSTALSLQEEFRRCMFCGRPVRQCSAFVLGRDFIRLWNGEKILPREMCGRCGLYMLIREDERYLEEAVLYAP